MPRQHPHRQQHLRPRWRSRLAGWLRGVAEVVDPDPDGLDLTGAPDFWAEHVRAAARRARKEGRAFRMRRWGADQQADPGAVLPHPHGGERAGSPERPGSGVSRATEAARPAVTRPERQPAPANPDPPHRRPGPTPSPPSGERRDRTLVPPVVRPRPPRTAPPPAEAAKAGAQRPTTGPGSPHADAPLVRPRATPRRVAAEPPPPTPEVPATPRPAAAVTVPGWPESSQVPHDGVRPDGSDWLRTPSLLPAADATGTWPDRPSPLPSAQRTPQPIHVLPSGLNDNDAATVAAARETGTHQLEPATLPESLWPELPVRPTATPIAPDPAPIMVRRERLAAEQAAT